MYCKKCGREIADDAVICGYCGTPVNAGAATGQPGQQGVYGEPAPQYRGQADGNPGYNGYRTAGQGDGNSGYGGYGMNGQGYGTPVAPMDGGAVGMAVTSLVLGIVSLLIMCCVNIWWITTLAAIFGIVFGAISLGKHMGGRGMAIAGIVCSIVALAFELLLIIVGISMFASFFSAFLQ